MVLFQLHLVSRMKKFNSGDIVYFIASSRIVKEAKVIRNAGGFVTIKFKDGNCGPAGTRVRESKLYHTKEEAEEIVKERVK